VPDGQVAFARAFSVEEGRRCADEILAVGGKPTAISAANDMLAVGCYQALELAGHDCPTDVSVVGFNDMPFMDMLRPPLTTVGFSHYQVGTQAAQLLLERLTGDVSDAGMVKVLYLEPELVVRGSTARPS
jgi:LacI family transcriptional regulator